MCVLLMKGCNVTDLSAKVPRFAEYNSGQDGNVLPIFQHRSSVCPAAWPRTFKLSTATSKCLIFPYARRMHPGLLDYVLAVSKYQRTVIETRPPV